MSKSADYIYKVNLDFFKRNERNPLMRVYESVVNKSQFYAIYQNLTDKKVSCINGLKVIVDRTALWEEILILRNLISIFLVSMMKISVFKIN